MAEYSANAVQVVNPGEAIVFTDSGNFLLSGWVPNRQGCSCRSKSANYLVDFGANISIPEGGTAGEISVAISIDGSTVPASTMIVTPAAVNEYFNISRAINVEVWNGCCETITVRNISDQPIQIQNANIIFSRPDLAITY